MASCSCLCRIGRMAIAGLYPLLMATVRSTGTKAASGQLSKAAQNRLKTLPKKLRGVGRRVELGEITISMFIVEIVRYVGDPARDDYQDVSYADLLLAYLRCLPPGRVEVEWVIDLLERYANVVLMRNTTGHFKRSTMHPKGSKHRPPVDEDALVTEVRDRFWDDNVRGAGRTLFDASTQRQTMRASLYAK
jgi:hypothetical protein